jgi:glutathione S-transferase
MSDMILYHYATSPYCEKIRAMLGYTGMRWESVTVREMPPRPELYRLAGGYRRVPVAQIGADIFCDSKAIAAEIARISGKAALSLDTCDPEVRAYANSAESEFMLACLGSAMGKKMIKKMLRMYSVLDFFRLTWDRVAMVQTSSLDMPGGKQAKATVREHLGQMEKRLEGGFLFGDQPTIADFAAYHAVWYIRDLAELDLIDDYPAVIAWMDRIKAFGHGTTTEISAGRAIDIATQQKPRPLPTDNQDDEWIGQSVSIAPSDYWREPVNGVLVASSAHSWILERRLNASSTANVHFPKQGFALETGMV